RHLWRRGVHRDTAGARRGYTACAWGASDGSHPAGSSARNGHDCGWSDRGWFFGPRAVQITPESFIWRITLRFPNLYRSIVVCSAGGRPVHLLARPRRIAGRSRHCPQRRMTPRQSIEFLHVLQTRYPASRKEGLVPDLMTVISRKIMGILRD